MDDALHSVMAYIISLLIVSYCIVYPISRRTKRQIIHHVLARLHAWAGIFILVFPALLLGKTATLLLFALISYLAVKEYFSISPIIRSRRRQYLCFYMLIPLHYGLFFTGQIYWPIIIIPILCTALFILRWILVKSNKHHTKSYISNMAGLFLGLYCISFIPLLGVLPALEDPSKYILYLLFVVQFNDVAQWCWGTAFGQRLVAPSISPNKTYEGLIGGVISSGVLSAVIAPTLTHYSHQQGFALGIALGALGFSGDLNISYIKRLFAVKDSSQMLLGHGGVLDRIDSLIYSAPAFFAATALSYSAV